MKLTKVIVQVYRDRNGPVPHEFNTVDTVDTVDTFEFNSKELEAYPPLEASYRVLSKHLATRGLEHSMQFYTVDKDGTYYVTLDDRNWSMLGSGLFDY